MSTRPHPEYGHPTISGTYLTPVHLHALTAAGLGELRPDNEHARFIAAQLFAEGLVDMDNEITTAGEWHLKHYTSAATTKFRCANAVDAIRYALYLAGHGLNADANGDTITLTARDTSR